MPDYGLVIDIDAAERGRCNLLPHRAEWSIKRGPQPEIRGTPLLSHLLRRLRNHLLRRLLKYLLRRRLSRLPLLRLLSRLSLLRLLSRLLRLFPGRL